ncbi:MAG: OmpA family protein [Saprospiraceae bacterium]
MNSTLGSCLILFDFEMNFLSILMLLYSSFLFSQNLVINGDFEEHTFIKNKKSGYYSKEIKGWNKFENVEFWPNLFYIDFENVSNIKPRSGFSFGSLNYWENCPANPYLTGCCSKIVANTKSVLKVGKLYKLEYWIYPKDNGITERNILNHVGIYLGNKFINPSMHYLIKPTIFLSGPSEFDKWNKVELYFRPLCELSYIYLSVFKTDTFPKILRPIESNVYFYFDDISITESREIEINEDDILKYCPYPLTTQENLFSEDTLKLFFNTLDTNLSNSDKLKLDNFYLSTRSNGYAYEILGYSDWIGQSKDNKKLSEQRSQAVMNYLISRFNIPEFIFTSKGMGEKNSKNQKLNTYFDRRVDIFINKLRIDQNLYNLVLVNLADSNYSMAFKYLNYWLDKVAQKRKIYCLFDTRLKIIMTGKNRDFVYNKVKSSYSNYINRNEAFYWDSIYCEDQKFRSLDFDIAELSFEIKLNLHTCELNNLKFHDSILANSLKQYLDKTFLPKLNYTGVRASSSIYNVLSHSNDTVLIDRTLPFIFKLCNEGEAMWGNYVMLVDKSLVLKNKPQIYGSQYIIKDETKNRLILAKMDDYNLVNERRKKLGLAKIYQNTEYNLIEK